MTHQIIENKVVRSFREIKKNLVTLCFLLFSLSWGVHLYANEPVSEGQTPANHAEQTDQHVEADHDAHAAEVHHEQTEEEFNAGDMIMHHIADAHDWHVFDFNGHAYSIPLPVIVLKDGAIISFLSNKFEHGHAVYKGLKLDHGKIVAVDGSKVMDFSITKNVAAIFISVLVLLLIFFTVAKGYKKRKQGAPKGIQSVLEPIILFIRDEVVKPSIGHGYEKFMPLLLTIFFFIFFNNLLGLIPLPPFGANVTGNIAVTMVLAVIVFMVTTFIAKKTYWKHIFMPDVPVWLYPIMIVIEIIGMFIKPFVLMLRLFANITAGHIIILGFLSLIFIFGNINLGGGFGAAAFSVSFSLFMSILELLVAFLQAYVFTLLSALYFGAALEEHHEH